METAEPLLQGLLEFGDSIAGSAYEPGAKVPALLPPPGLTSGSGQTVFT